MSKYINIKLLNNDSSLVLFNSEMSNLDGIISVTQLFPDDDDDDLSLMYSISVDDENAVSIFDILRKKNDLFEIIFMAPSRTIISDQELMS